MAFTSLAALAGGTAATTTLVLGAVAEVGLAMTVVGGVTGNEKLMKVGGVLGLVGGIGGMIAGASGGAAAGVSAEAGGVNAVNGADLMSDAFAQNAASGAAGGFGAAEGAALGLNGADLMSDLFSGVGQGGFSSPEAWTNFVDDAGKALGEGGDALSQAASETTGGAGADAMQPGQAAQATQEAARAATQPQQPLIQPQAPIDPFQGTTPLNQQMQSAADPTNYGLESAKAGRLGDINASLQDPNDWFKKFLSFAKENKEVMNTAVQLGGGLLKGMNERSMFEQKMALERSRGQFGNQVARLYGRSAQQPLIGARA